MSKFWKKLVHINSDIKLFSFLKFIILFASTIGCVYQINAITKKYFQYRVTALVRIDMVDTVEMPDVTILFSSPFAINYTKIVEMIPETENYFPVDPINNRSSFLAYCLTLEGFMLLTLVLSYFRICDLNKARWRGKDLMQLKYVIDPNDKTFALFDVKAENICKFNDFIAGDFFGTTVNCNQNGSPLIYSVNDVLVGASKGYMMMLEFSPEAINDLKAVLVTFSPPNKYEFTLQQPRVSLDFHKGPQTYTISFKKVINKLLPYPYTTDCIDYTKKGYKSRKHMIAECENNISKELSGAPFFENLHDINDEQTSFTGYKQRFNEFFELNDELRLQWQKEYDAARVKCRRKAQNPDCIQYFYSPSSIETLKTPYYAMVLNVPDRPDIITEYHPKMVIIDYFIYVGSTLGIWFGFSVSITSIEMMNLIVYKFNKWIQKFKSLIINKKNPKKFQNDSYLYGHNEQTFAPIYTFIKPKKIKPYKSSAQDFNFHTQMTK